MNRSVLEG
jgi:hypothetical protein